MILNVLILSGLCALFFWFGYGEGVDAERMRWWRKQDAEWAEWWKENHR